MFIADPEGVAAVEDDLSKICKYVAGN